MLLLGYALAALLGLSLGLMGWGGSILTAPIFVYVLAASVLQARGRTNVVNLTGGFAEGHKQKLPVEHEAGAHALAGAK